MKDRKGHNCHLCKRNGLEDALENITGKMFPLTILQFVMNMSLADLKKDYERLNK